MTDTEKLANELKEMWLETPNHDAWTPLSKHVQRMILEARINEADEHLYDSTMAEERIKHLKSKLDSL